MARIHRGQLFIRGGWRDGEDTLHAVAGFAQADAGAEEHVITGYAAQSMPDGVLLTGTAHREKADRHDLLAAEVDTMITGQKWPRPSDGLAGGGIMMRRTRVPAPPGWVTMIVAGLFSSRGPLLDDQSVVDIAGTVGSTLVIDNPRCVRDWKTPGSTLSQVLKSPRWGWDEAPWGIVSTMDLKSIDQAMALEAMMADPDADPEEIERLRQTPGGWALRCAERDHEYQRFRIRMVAEAGLLRWDGVLTRSESARREAIAARIVRDMMQAA